METSENVVSAPAAPAESAPATEQVTSAPSTEPGTSEAAAAPQAPPEAPKPEAPSRLQKRIDELTKARYEEQRRADEYQQKLAQYERQQTLSRQFSEIDAAAPNIDQFDNLHSYQLAMADWTTKRAAAVAHAQWEQRMQEYNAQQAQFSQQALERQHQVMRENVMIEERMAAGAKKYPDFQAALTNPDLPAVRGTPLFQAVLAAENAADIAYALAKNPAELDRLLSIREPMHLAREVFRLDAKFSGNGATSAPPPPPSRTGSPSVDKPTSQMSTAEWIANRERELKARAARG